MSTIPNRLSTAIKPILIMLSRGSSLQRLQAERYAACVLTPYKLDTFFKMV